MNTNDYPDSTAPLPDPQGDFETYMRHAMAAVIARLISVENTVNQLSRDVQQLSQDQRDRYVDLRLRVVTLDEKIDAHLREGMILKRDVQKLQDKVDRNLLGSLAEKLTQAKLRPPLPRPQQQCRHKSPVCDQ